MDIRRIKELSPRDLSELLGIDRPPARSDGEWALESARDLLAVYLEDGGFPVSSLPEEVSCDVADIDTDSLRQTFVDLFSWKFIEGADVTGASDFNEFLFRSVARVLHVLCEKLLS